MKLKAEYLTGIHNIDHQHKEIVGFIALYEKRSEDKANSHELGHLMLRTREFMQMHFSTEEHLMRLLAYPDYDLHRAEHQRELGHIADIERQVLRGNMYDGSASLMRQCLFGHIVTGDKRLAQYALSLFG